MLLALFEQDGLTQAALARQLEVEQPTVATTLKRMQRDGLIRRKPHRTDGRQEHLHLTSRARALTPQLFTMVDEVHGIALAGLTADEVQTLLALLHRVSHNLRADTPDP